MSTAPSPDTITVAELDAMRDADFIALFAGGPALTSLIVALGQQAETVEVAS